MNIFEIYPAKNQFIGIVSIPHSGEMLPEEFKSFLTDNQTDLMQDVDYRVHELVHIDKLQEAGISVIKANIIRTAVDLNRSRDLALLNWKKNSKGRELVLKTPDSKQVEYFLGNYYDPYYEMLKTLINELKNKQKIASFVDLHSMPGKAEEYHLKINPNQPINRPEFCISDIEGKSCTQDFIDHITHSLQENYKNVSNNMPYFGGHITRHLNASHQDLNNIQIEINRSIYMNEETKELNNNEKLRNHLTDGLIKLFNQY